MAVLTLIDGKLRIAESGAALVLSEDAENPCCCCANEVRFFRGFENPNTWFKSAFWHDEDECYFQDEFRPDGSLKLTAVEPDDQDIPEGENYCGLFKVTDGSNWFTQQLPIGTYVRRGGGGGAAADIWNPPAPGGPWIIESNTKLVLNGGPDDPCKNFGDKIWLELSDEVQF